MIPTVQQFITQCQSGSNEAYQQFKQLLQWLDDETTRKPARQLLSALRHLKDTSPDLNFKFLQQQVLAHDDKKQLLHLLQFPSTFEPEAWSFTFYEGLIRYPAAQYRDLKLIELGCGIGWISIALALRYQIEKIHGLDINPKAITCARLNLYLAALDDNGDPIEHGNRQNLLERVEFVQSDLCDHFASQHDCFDRIIGCIPQVLNPQPLLMETQVAESASDEYLQSLSNYSVQQGYLEDQFGLGLISRAVEQAIGLLKSNGRLILNLGGRPGRLVLENLMKRRGFKVRRVWQTQVEQANDTDIDALVAIEKSGEHRFEFYMSVGSRTPIDARTAQAYLQKQGVIYHSVDVYEARMKFPQQVKSIYRQIERIGNEQLSSAIDLTYDQVAYAEERYSFLSLLVRWLAAQDGFPYEDSRGLLYFRQQIVEYMRYYNKVKYVEAQVLISPGRSEMLTNLLSAYSPRLTLIDKALRSLLSDTLDTNDTEIIESPSSVEYLVELIDKLKPQVVITRLGSEEGNSAQLVKSLVNCAISNNVLLVIDLTDDIELSSDPKGHGVYRYLSNHAHPDNLILTLALINNRVYEHYSLNITLLTNQSINQTLVDAADLTYSRTAVLNQLYFAHLLEELLYFQRTRINSEQPPKSAEQASSTAMLLSPGARCAFQYPAVTGSHLPFTSQTIRLDYGENELSAPALLKDAIFKSYLVRNFSPNETTPKESIRILLENRFGLTRSIYAKIAFFNGVAPLFNALLSVCRKAGKSLIIPSGSYGYFTAAAAFESVAVKVLETDEKNDFKMTATGLAAILTDNPGSWFLLNAPIINPTGAIYSQQELNEILAVATRYQATVVLDSIFCGLEFDDDMSCNLKDSLQDFAHSPDAQFILMGGLSKEYSAGGLRFGYAWSPSNQLMEQLSEATHTSPHETLCYAVRELIEAYNQGDNDLLAHLATQRQILARRAEQLSELLQRKGWQVLKPKGGLFLVAKPQKYIIDSQRQDSQLSSTEGANRMTTMLFEQVNVVINNATWTGLPGYCRFVLSIKEADFIEALARIERFEG